MKKRGRKSQADLDTVVSYPEFMRPPPPSDMPDDQAGVWRNTVDSMPVDWFPRETHEVLKQYCRHAVTAMRVRLLIDQIEEGDTFDLEQYDRALRMQEREGRALSSLATRMRITQQSRINATTAGRRQRDTAKYANPWEE